MRRVIMITAAVLGAAGFSAPAMAQAASSAGPVPTVKVHGLHLVKVKLPPTHLPHLTPHAVVSSRNWSGYAAVAKSGVRLRYVAANFTVPSVNCAASTLGSSGFAYASNWAGIDGFSSSTVEQTGVDSFCDTSGTAQYDAWYEMFPLNPVVFSGVNPGDAIAVSVYFNGTVYSLTLTDLTTGGKVQTSQPCPQGSTCRNSSAEIITEDPGNAEPTVDLADFGMANITGAAVTSVSGTRGTLAANSLWTSTEIVMKDASKKAMAQPSALYGGQAFNVRWLASQ